VNDRLLGIYLNDHFAGGALARARCRNAAVKNRGSDLGAFLETLLREIDEDRDTLRRVMEAVGSGPSQLKIGAGVAAERLARLKPNGRLTGYSPLTRLLELEGLSIGVEGKRLMWSLLRELGDSRLAPFDFEALALRAAGQRERLERHRLAARIALA
jgi:hypothetical protein